MSAKDTQLNLNSFRNRLDNSYKNLKRRYNKSENKRWITAGIVALVLLALLFLLSNVFVAALVNGRPISRLEVINELENRGGGQVLDSLITEQLIKDEARKQGVNISEEDIDARISDIEASLQGQGMDIESALSFQGQTMEDLRDNVRTQIMIEELLGDDIEVTDDEIAQYFEENQSLYGENATLEEFESEIRNQIHQQKLSEKYQEWIETIRSEANIRRLVDY